MRQILSNNTNTYTPSHRPPHTHTQPTHTPGLHQCTHPHHHTHTHTHTQALTRTISLAFPELLKFLLCAGILFLAFTFNGWIILGPYHEKFVGFGGSFETLFSLINGDDIYTTFTGIDMEDSVVVYVYSRLYMYVFLILFLYFVLNLFTSLVISAYEASRVRL